MEIGRLERSRLLRHRNGLLSILLFLLSVLVKQSYSGSILVLNINSIASPSLNMVMSTITGGLVERGHTVTLVSSGSGNDDGFDIGTFTNVLRFQANSAKSDIDTEDFARTVQASAFSSSNGNSGLIKFLVMMAEFYRQVYSNCLDLWKDKAMLSRLKETTTFDIVLVVPYSSCDVLLAFYLNTPFVVVTPSIRAYAFHEGVIGMPAPASFVPFDLTDTLTDEMTFWERLKNLAHYLVLDVTMNYLNTDYRSIQREFNLQPDKTVKELYSKASLWLCHTSLAADYARPYTPNFIHIGGLLAREGKPLSEDLETFVAGSGEHGIIIFSLGSLLPGLLDKEHTEIFSSVFRRLQQRVIWRHNDEAPSDLGTNVKIMSWLPQNDLLGHPKTRLLIYHGGSNGVSEAIHHGVPMVIIPLFGDQFAHAGRVQKKGMGVILDKTNITEENLMVVIGEVLDNPKYAERAQHLSQLHRDAPTTPLKRALHWIEHVMKFGDDHLRPRSSDMHWVELYMVDVTIFIASVACIFLWTVYISCKRMMKILRIRTYDISKSKYD